MDENTLSLLVILAVGLLVVLILVLSRRNRAAKEKALAQMALERGWKLEVVREHLVYGQRIRHNDWVIESLIESSGKPEAEGSSNVMASTVWKSPVTGSTVLVGPRTTQISLGGFGDFLSPLLGQLGNVQPGFAGPRHAGFAGPRWGNMWGGSVNPRGFPDFGWGHNLYMNKSGFGGGFSR